MDLRRYIGRSALVTGAGSGIGRASAVRLAQEGAHVVCLDRDAGPTADVVRAIRADGGSADASVVDLSDPTALRTALASVVTGELDLVANVAGIARTVASAEEDEPGWDHVLAVDLTAVFQVVQATLPALLRCGGAVVNVASVAALGGRPYLAAYSAAKGGVVALTRSLAVEYAHQGVRFCCVCPGSVATPLSSGLQPPTDARPELLARGRSLLPQPQATPEDVAAAVAYLGSAEARFATGTVLVLDGGALA